MLQLWSPPSQHHALPSGGRRVIAQLANVNPGAVCAVALDALAVAGGEPVQQVHLAEGVRVLRALVLAGARARTEAPAAHKADLAPRARRQAAIQLQAPGRAVAACRRDCALHHPLEAVVAPRGPQGGCVASDASQRPLATTP